MCYAPCQAVAWEEIGRGQLSLHFYPFGKTSEGFTLSVSLSRCKMSLTYFFGIEIKAFYKEVCNIIINVFPTCLLSLLKALKAKISHSFLLITSIPVHSWKFINLEKSLALFSQKTYILHLVRSAFVQCLEGRKVEGKRNRLTGNYQKTSSLVWKRINKAIEV